MPIILFHPFLAICFSGVYHLECFLLQISENLTHTSLNNKVDLVAQLLKFLKIGQIQALFDQGFCSILVSWLAP